MILLDQDIHAFLDGEITADQYWGRVNARGAPAAAVLSVIAPIDEVSVGSLMVDAGIGAASRLGIAGRVGGFFKRLFRGAGRNTIPDVPRGVGLSQKVENQANHIFGAKNLAKHKLGGVLDSFDGDPIEAFRAVETSAQKLANNGAIEGIFETTVKVGENMVTVRGRVIDGVVNVSTAFIP